MLASGGERVELPNLMFHGFGPDSLLDPHSVVRPSGSATEPDVPNIT